MRVLICGDRYWKDSVTIARVLRELPEGTEIIHGGAQGADHTAAYIARNTFHMPTKAYYADWKKHGRAAGPIRNRQMLDTKPDRVIAFHDNLDASKGTRDCVTEARRRGIPVEVFASAALRSASARARSAPPGGAEDGNGGEPR